MVKATFGEKIVAWAESEPSVEALVQIGSRLRDESDAVWAADAQSDWDFLVISSRPELFATSSWLKGAGAKPITYVVRTAQLGGVPKVAVVFDDAEADFVIQPAPLVRKVGRALARGVHRQHGPIRTALQDLAVVIRPGWKFWKGAKMWEPLYRRVVAEVADRRVDEAEARSLADGFVCDALWTRRKIARGEFLAAQRMLHRSLADTNFRLLHELQLRRGMRSFPEARRIERVARAAELSAVTVSAVPTAKSLRAAVAKSSATLRRLMRSLAPGWRWASSVS